MEKLMNSTYFYKGKEYEFTYRTDLNLMDKDIFVMNVCDILIDENAYHYLLKDLIFDFQILVNFTDVDLSELKESDARVYWMENFLKETNIVDIVKFDLKEGLLDELKEAIDINLEYRTGIHRNTLYESLSSFVNKLEKTLDGVDANEMMKMSKILSNMSGELTTDKLVQAYINSSAFKNK